MHKLAEFSQQEAIIKVDKTYVSAQRKGPTVRILK